ncbi:MAG: hypothetical protein IJS45_10375 [Clostridia bacterium]|nr:hypothetical protein [Clostridia bacterium]
MDMLSYIKAGIKKLYETHPDVHINVRMTRPTLTLLNEPVTIISVYRHLFQIQEHSSGYERKYSVPYTDVLTNQVEILELKRKE